MPTALEIKLLVGGLIREKRQLSRVNPWWIINFRKQCNEIMFVRSDEP